MKLDITPCPWCTRRQRLNILREHTLTVAGLRRSPLQYHFVDLLGYHEDTFTVDRVTVAEEHFRIVVRYVVCPDHVGRIIKWLNRLSGDDYRPFRYFTTDFVDDMLLYHIRVIIDRGSPVRATEHIISQL